MASPQDQALDAPEPPPQPAATTALVAGGLSEASRPEDGPDPATQPFAEGAAGAEAGEGAAAVDDGRDHRFECLSCGFVFDPAEGIRKLGIEPGVAFEDLDPLSFRCPVCRSKIGAFKDIGPRNKPSGFEENLGFGLGVNQLTPGQKNVLIFSAFALAIAFFLSLYSLR
ncbi:rubredoxin [Cyanobium sp. Morenito 9A2]|uniref:rubredoxin n=1 Tax=Cyanobium sp. Morenito 9A2 TaxID=2823718 RepID=UPI0020CE4339|nr:rubredoxin [Cyanobium sp. Morenito 9A2]MCP9849586.1 rubredoxin [Cyanobium sp. Morenito 9A2]